LHSLLKRYLACEVLVETHYGSYSCRKTYVDYADIVQKTKPDYLFIIERHLAIQPKENELNETARESIQQQAEARIQTFKKFVRSKIFILDAMPRLYTKAISLLNSRISRSSAINQVFLRKESSFFRSHVYGCLQTELIEPTDVKFAQQTLRRAIRSCEKCSLISYEAVFGLESNFRVFNNATKVAYFTGGLHLSPYGLNSVAPIYKKICSLF
uniref:SGNH domain-containing protein n=1 Tax=Heligmosomoides polygyrus TaxID=6339 RepID=A0A183GNT3_HELPZ